jgi:GNAT superfamily N-acetyltransferase
MRVREAHQGDLGRLLELYRFLEGPYSAVEELGGEAAERRFAEILADPNQTSLVAEAEGEVVGTLVVAILPNLAHGGAPYAVVENVVTDPAWRGRGVGKALMGEAVRLARDAGAYKLALCSNLAREEAHGFYRSVGMRETHLGFEVAP